MSATATSAQWFLKGTTVIGCNCDWGCPCNFNARPTMGFCAGVWGWQIEEGECDGVNLSGLNIAQAARWPGAIHEGGGSAINFVDERANEDQRKALGMILSGQAGEGGPFAIFNSTFIEAHGPRSVKIEIDTDKRNPRVVVGDTARSVLEPIHNPVNHEEETFKVVHPNGGFIWDEAFVLNAAECRISDPKLCFTFPGKHGHLAEFDYQSA